MNMRQFPPLNLRTILILILAVIAFLVVLSFAGRFGYFFRTIEHQEVGVQFRGGRIYNIVGPGVYSDVGLFVALQEVSGQAIPFTVSDEEIITRDKQRIGIVVS